MILILIYSLYAGSSCHQRWCSNFKPHSSLTGFATPCTLTNYVLLYMTSFKIIYKMALQLTNRHDLNTLPIQSRRSQGGCHLAAAAGRVIPIYIGHRCQTLAARGIKLQLPNWDCGWGNGWNSWFPVPGRLLNPWLVLQTKIGSNEDFFQVRLGRFRWLVMSFCLIVFCYTVSNILTNEFDLPRSSGPYLCFSKIGPQGGHVQGHKSGCRCQADSPMFCTDSGPFRQKSTSICKKIDVGDNLYNF
jgi:hypothetical protein